MDLAGSILLCVAKKKISSTCPSLSFLLNSYDFSTDQFWGYSSAGRALAWHARGQQFDPAYLHQISNKKTDRKSVFLCLIANYFKFIINSINEFIQLLICTFGHRSLEVSLLCYIWLYFWL